MTSKAALCMALLEGRVLNIKNGFELFGITNIPREIGRSVERAFNVTVSRVPREGTSRYGQSCVWVDYRLNKSQHNLPGIAKMKEYIREQLNSQPPAKTEKQLREFKRQQSVINFK